MKRILLVMAVAALAVPAFAGDDIGPVALINFVVMRDANAKPVRNAAVIVHGVGRHDKQERGGIELKTDADGKASFEGIPYGKWRVQVLAPGFQTFGGDYDVDKPTVEVTVKLKRPGGQYSIYEDHPGEKKDAADPKAKPQP